MNKIKSFLKKAVKQLVVLLLITGGVYGTVLYFTPEKETTEQYVNRIHNFYVDSGYNKKSLYVADIELLQEYKQEAVDMLSYKDTIKYISIQNKQSSGMIDNDWLNLINETLKLANEGIARVEVPEYLMIDTTKSIEKKEPTASELVFQNLLK